MNHHNVCETLFSTIWVTLVRNTITPWLYGSFCSVLLTGYSCYCSPLKSLFNWIEGVCINCFLWFIPMNREQSKESLVVKSHPWPNEDKQKCPHKLSIYIMLHCWLMRSWTLTISMSCWYFYTMYELQSYCVAGWFSLGCL